MGAPGCVEQLQYAMSRLYVGARFFSCVNFGLERARIGGFSRSIVWPI
jgi:hypothetical protein